MSKRFPLLSLLLSKRCVLGLKLSDPPVQLRLTLGPGLGVSFGCEEDVRIHCGLEQLEEAGNYP